MAGKPKSKRSKSPTYEHIVMALLSAAYDLFRMHAPGLPSNKNINDFHILAHCAAIEFEKRRRSAPPPDTLLPALQPRTSGRAQATRRRSRDG